MRACLNISTEKGLDTEKEEDIEEERDKKSLTFLPKTIMATTQGCQSHDEHVAIWYERALESGAVLCGLPFGTAMVEDHLRMLLVEVVDVASDNRLDVLPDGSVVLNLGELLQPDEGGEMLLGVRGETESMTQVLIDVHVRKLNKLRRQHFSHVGRIFPNRLADRSKLDLKGQGTEKNSVMLKRIPPVRPAKNFETSTP